MNKAYSNWITWANLPSMTSPIDQIALNKISNGLDEVDDRVIVLDSSKANLTDLSNLFKAVSYNESTGTLVFTKYDNTTVTINTALEKIAVNFAYDYQTQRLIITLADGTVQYVDLSALLTQYEFVNSSEIAFTVDNTGKVSASIRTIGSDKIDPDFIAQMNLKLGQAQTYAELAGDYADQAGYERMLAKTYSIGDESIREGSSTDNSRYYSLQSKSHSETAKQWADYIEQYADMLIPEFYFDTETCSLYLEDLSGKRADFVLEGGDLYWGVVTEGGQV